MEIPHFILPILTLFLHMRHIYPNCRFNISTGYLIDITISIFDLLFYLHPYKIYQHYYQLFLGKISKSWLLFTTQPLKCKPTIIIICISASELIPKFRPCPLICSILHTTDILNTVCHFFTQNHQIYLHFALSKSISLLVQVLYHWLYQFHSWLTL